MDSMQTCLFLTFKYVHVFISLKLKLFSMRFMRWFLCLNVKIQAKNQHTELKILKFWRKIKEWNERKCTRFFPISSFSLLGSLCFLFRWHTSSNWFKFYIKQEILPTINVCESVRVCICMILILMYCIVYMGHSFIMYFVTALTYMHSMYTHIQRCVAQA